MTCEAVHCFDKATVRFAMYPDGPDGTRVLAEISEDALRDVFGACGDGSSMVEACKTHFDVIEACAVMRFRSHPQGPLDLGTDDFWPRSVRGAASLPRTAFSTGIGPDMALDRRTTPAPTLSQ